MNDDIFAGKWHQLKGKVKENWGKLTDDDLTKINGKREQLRGSLQERYGWHKQRAEEEMKKFEDSWSDSPKRAPFEDYQKGRKELYKGEDDEDKGGKSKKRKIG